VRLLSSRENVLKNSRPVDGQPGLDDLVSLRKPRAKLSAALIADANVDSMRSAGPPRKRGDEHEAMMHGGATTLVPEHADGLIFGLGVVSR